MSKRLAPLLYLCLSVFLCGPSAWAQCPARTTITDTIYNADGSLAAGRVVIAWPSFNIGSCQVVAGQASVTVTNGAFSVQLYPNDAATPAGTSYRATYYLKSGKVTTEYWVVPTSATPVALAAVRSSTVPVPTVMFSQAQVTNLVPDLAQKIELPIPCVTGKFLQANGSPTQPQVNCVDGTGGGGGSGTVTSVGLGLPAQFSVSGSPVTSSGTLSAAWVNVAANVVLAGPASGGAAAPSFRSLVAADIPASLTSSTTGNAATATLAAAASALAANGANCAGNNFALGVDATGASECAQPAFANLSGALALAQTPLTARGDLLVANTTPALVRLAIGANSTFLRSNGTDPAWAAVAFADVTGTVSDAQLASNYSGTGACTNQFVRAVNDNTAPTCASVAGSDFANQSANLVLAGPASGGAAAPSFRALVAADVPNISSLNVGTAATARANLGVRYGLAAGFFSTFNPADGTTYYMGSGDAVDGDVGDNNRHRLVIPIAGTVERFCVLVRVAGTLGSGESVTAVLRKNGATDSTESLTMTWNAANPSVACANVSSFTVAEDDLLSLKFTTPAWATNPTNVSLRWSVKILQDQ